ncbi:hypothetical protein ADIS_4147 [Lunatimonas lonarensis]|uniref:Uncharacterized protein n=1 Tax=Lunatimonas lonarensis TaxID=1232681 RepID=R7ZMY4_9BACT|nr:hypothetical protein ADIS_4147 [Lunatimonas lonarensis]
MIFRRGGLFIGISKQIISLEDIFFLDLFSERGMDIERKIVIL